MYPSDKKDRQRKRTSTRSLLKLQLLPVLILILLATFQSTAAAVQTLSGSTEQLGNVLGHGSTSYVVDYTYPSVAQVGSNLTIAVTLHVGQFSGLVGYITAYALQVALDVGVQQLQVTLYGPAGFNASSNLYPGGIWGPNNATFSLTAANTGLAVGQSDNATFSVTLRDSVEVGYPYNQYETEPAMQGQGGTLLIENAVATSTSSVSSTSTSHPVGTQSILPYALLASGAVLIAAAVFLPRGPRQPAPSPKS